VRSRRNRFILLLTAVFAIKLVVVLQLRDHPLLQPDAGLDTSVYATLAARVMAGDVALGPGLYFVSPLYIYFLAAVLATFGSYTAVRIMQVALGTAAVGLLFVATREWFGRRAAWIAAILAALTGVFTFFEALLLQAALDPFLTAAALAALALALTRARGMRAGRWFFLSGLAFGIQSLNRPNVLIPALVVGALLLATRRWRPALLIAAGLAVALAPITLRNMAVAGDWSPVSSHGGLNFYIGNNPEADGTYHSVPGITPNIAGQQEDARRVAEQAVGRKLSDGEVSAYFYELGWRWIRQRPAAAAALFVRKLAYLFNAAHLTLNYSYPFYAYDTGTLLVALIVGAWLLIPIGLTGLLIAAPRERMIPYLVWVSFVPAYAVSVAMFFVSERYRLPLLVPLCVGAAAALDVALDALVKAAPGEVPRPARTWLGTHPIAAVVLAAALFVIVNWRFGLDDGRAEERTRMAEQLIANGRFKEGEDWAAKAESGQPRPGLLNFRIGRQLILQHQPEAAVQHLERALTFDRDRPEVDYALGQALLDAGRPSAAIPHLRKALKASVRADLAGFDLARALAATGDRAGALQVLETVHPQNDRDAGSWFALGELAMQLQAPAIAESLLRRAVATAPQAAKPRAELGLSLAALGRAGEAVVELERAVALDPSDPTTHLNLAVASAQAGRMDDARRHAREALRLKPDYDRAQQLLAALK
jgi:tetratricopeptide (TPR) repeat protein